MIRKEVLEILVCPSCRADALGLGAGRYPTLECGECGTSYPFEHGIVDLRARAGGKPVLHYRTESLYDMIAPWYDVAAPLMSMTVWNCPPLRYIDWAHRAVGRAAGGRLLVNPVGTGLILEHVHSVHTDFPIVAIDMSRRMLRAARQRLEKAGVENVALLRAEPENLPFKAGSFRAAMTMNGLNGFHDRPVALTELTRTLEVGGTVAGSALCRGRGALADRVLAQYERWGIYPMLRGRDYLIEELRGAFGVHDLEFVTHGAVVFFLGTIATGNRHEATDTRASEPGDEP